jgi:heme/copper-type cytochrome/quinol oxidase subunit 2
MLKSIRHGGSVGECMVARDTVFAVLYEKFMFWSILVGIFTFGWLFLAVLRYRDGVEPDTTHIDHIKVGSFPVDRHNTRIELLFYILPTIIVVWLVVLALASNTEVWKIPEDDNETNDMTIVGKQWFWEFHYDEELTWEDDSRLTKVDVNWASTLTVDASQSSATNVTIIMAGEENTYPLDQMTGMFTMSQIFDSGTFTTIEVTDSDGNLVHTWMHIPEGHMFSSASNEPMILPCDENTVFTMHSQPSDDSNPNYVGVQHSFWLPEWGVKEDLVPGLESGTVMMATPDRPGEFPLRCAEYCGNQHSMMNGYVKVVAREWTGVGTPQFCDYDSGVKADSTGGGY